MASEPERVSSVQAADILREAGFVVEDGQSPAPLGARGLHPRLEPLNLPALLREPLKEPNYVIDQILIHGEVCRVTAFWGVGKTWLGMAAALAVADPTVDAFLERPVVTGPVLYVDEESSLELVQERLLLLGADPDRLGGLHFYLNQSVRLDDEDMVGELHVRAREIGPVLVVFDSFPRFHSREENSSGDMAALYDGAIKPLARDLGAAVLILDFPPKDTMGRSRDPAQANRGSGDKMAQVDRGWLLRRQGEDAFTLEHNKVRRGTWPPSFLVRRLLGEGRVTLMNAGEASVEVAKIEADVLAAIDTLRGDGGSAYREHLVAVIGDEKRTDRAMKRAEARGLVGRDKDGRRVFFTLRGE